MTSPDACQWQAHYDYLAMKGDPIEFIMDGVCPELLEPVEQEKSE